MAAMPNSKLQRTRYVFEMQFWKRDNRIVRIVVNSLKAVKLPNIFAKISQAPRARRRDSGNHPT